NNLSRAQTSLNRSIERLSSGLKVNRGSDGPAALVVSEKQRAQIAGLRTAIDNTEKAVSVVQTAEGALGEINSLLVKVRGLALDSANTGVNDDDALAANQAEIANALDTINRIANNTQFGSKKLLDGSAGKTGTASDADVTFLQAGSATAAGTYAVNVTTAAERAYADAGTDQTAALAADETLTVNGVSISLSAGLDQAGVVSRINEYSGQTGVTARVDGTTTQLYTEDFGSGASISVVSNVAAAATSSGFGTTAINDSGVDVAGTIGGTAASGAGNVLSSTAGSAEGISVRLATSATPTTSVTGAQGNVTVTDNSLTFQIGPSQNQTVNLAIDKVNPTALGVGLANNQFGTLDSVDVTSAAKAQDSLAVIDAAIEEVAGLRGKLGAFQSNTLEATANNLRATLENTVNAESVIRDTDFAQEISNFTNNQVLVQAGASVLSSANQTSQLVLSLLR
ncbi:MAG: flagellin, partial [Planctomycetota bacterium]